MKKKEMVSLLELFGHKLQILRYTDSRGVTWVRQEYEGAPADFVREDSESALINRM